MVSGCKIKKIAKAPGEKNEKKTVLGGNISGEEGTIGRKPM